MDKLLFSIVVPIYNVERYLEQCINSILSQTYKSFELILVDDGSTDNCSAICDDYMKRDERVKTIHKLNGGLVSARKTGAMIAEGNYIVCVDGDDWLDKKCLEYYADIIHKNSPDIIVTSAIYAFQNKSKNYINHLTYREGFYDSKDINKELFQLLIQGEYANCFVPNIWGKAYRTDLYKKYQLAVPAEIKIGEDGACTIPCIYHSDSLYIADIVTYYYRQNPLSMTKNKKSFSWEDPETIYKHIQTQIDTSISDFEEQLHRKTAHSLFNVAVSQFYRSESYKVIIKDIKEHLQLPLYADCIQKANFSSFNGKLALFALRHRLYLLMLVYSKIK